MVEKTNAKEDPVKSKQLKSGEEDYSTLFKAKAKLYRFRDNMWKERGVGFAKIQRNDNLKQIRMLMRNTKMKKTIANFLIADNPLC